MKWIKVKFLGTKVPCTLWWHYNGGTCLYWDSFIWCVSCTVVFLTCFVMCEWVYVRVFWQLCGCFGNMCTCIDCFVLFVLCFCIVSFVYMYSYLFCLRGPGSSVGIATDYGLDGPASNPGGDEIFRPSRPALGPTQPPVNGYRVFPGGKVRPGVLLTTHPLLVPRSWKSRAIPLPTLWATPGL